MKEWALNQKISRKGAKPQRPAKKLKEFELAFLCALAPLREAVDFFTASLLHVCAPSDEHVSPSGKVLDGTPVRMFRNREAWAAWLGKNYHLSRGLWLRLAKKGSALQSLSYSEALEVALCYGWIDGQKRSDTDRTWLQRFVPRRDNSVWSKINREKALALIERGEMKPAGLQAIERAKINGRWRQAYDSPSRAVVSPDLAMALDANPRAKAFFESLDGANRYAVLFRIQTVKKPETRAKKIRQFVEMLERHEKIHPSRTPPPK